MGIKYKSLAESLKKEISLRGPLGNQKLPTEAELMRTYGVSRQTVREALSLLVREGLIEKRHGSGTFIAPGVFPDALSSHNIALLVPDVTEYLSQYSIGETEALLNEAGYTTAVYCTENRAYREREILLNLLEHPVRGILAGGVRTVFPNPNISLYQELLSLGVSVVFLGEAYPELQSNHTDVNPLPASASPSDSRHEAQSSSRKSPVLQVTSDDFGGGELLARHLIGLGHKKIAGIFRLDNHSGRSRYAGILHALCECGLPFDERDFLWYDPLTTRMPDSKVVLSFIRIQLAGCTAVICQNEPIAAALIRELERLGMPVPQQFSIAAFSSDRETSFPSRITRAIRPGRKPWVIAADLLLAEIAGKTVSSVSCPWTLQPGDSTGAAN